MKATTVSLPVSQIHVGKFIAEKLRIENGMKDRLGVVVDSLEAGRGIWVTIFNKASGVENRIGRFFFDFDCFREDTEPCALPAKNQPLDLVGFVVFSGLCFILEIVLEVSSLTESTFHPALKLGEIVGQKT